MENEPNRAGSQAGGPHREPSERLEIAHVLFMDLVSFSTLAMEQQRRDLQELERIVQSTPEVQTNEASERLILIPTGDGMALVFFGDPLDCARAALDISANARKSGLRLRIGINTGPVFRVPDINTNLNVSGGGINAAQRIMDAGDAGHILVSKSTADILQQLEYWAICLHDLGEHPVKHGVKLRFYNLYNSDSGNPALPLKFRKRTMARLRIRAAAVLACGLTLGLGFYASQHMGSRRRNTVAVMGFRNITATPSVEWVSTDLSDGLRAELASTGKLRAISAEESTEMWKDLGLTQLESIGKSNLQRLHNRGVDTVIVGSYTDLSDRRIHLNVVIQDAAAGETIDSLLADGTEAEISQLVRETGQRLRTKMGLGQLSPDKERQIALSQPSSEAAPLYSEGVAKLRAYEPIQARSFLQRAIVSDPAYPYAHAALAEAWYMLGYDHEAQQAARKAFELSSGLSFEDKTSIEARYRGIASDWPGAMKSYQRLYDYAPQNLDYGLKLAEAERSAGKGQEGLKTLARLRKLPKPEGDDPRIDLEEAETAASLGDLKRGLAVAASAVKKAQATGARLLESRSLIWSCSALRTLGELDKAKQSCEQARTIAVEVQDNLAIARAVNNLANILSDQGDLNGAQQLFEKALAIGQTIGDQRDVAGALNNIGIVAAGQGNLAEAMTRYQEALRTEKEIGFTAEIPKTLLNQGVVLHQEGDLAGAQAAFERALEAAQESGSLDVVAASSMNLGVVLFERGNLEEANRRYQEAITIQRRLGAQSAVATTLDSLGDLLQARGNLADAEQRYREALSIQQKLGEKGSQAASKASLANLLLEKNLPEQAALLASAAADEFHAEKDKDDEVIARIVLARALASQKKMTEAERQADAAGALASIEDLSKNGQYDVLIALARMRTAVGEQAHLRNVLDLLQTVARQTRKKGMPGLELDARLAIGEIESVRGDRGQATAEFSAVRKKASASGYLLIAQKAGAELNPR